MAIIEVKIPEMGEGITEATITKWLKKENDSIVKDESLVEIATDKVDSDIPAPASGTIKKLLFKEGDVAGVGSVIAIIATAGEESAEYAAGKPEISDENTAAVSDTEQQAPVKPAGEMQKPPTQSTDRRALYSPLVKKIAKEENVSPAELETISGSGKDGRLTKHDLFAFLKNRQSSQTTSADTAPQKPGIHGETIIEMDRMRKIIADHMLQSLQTSAHVTSFAEVDMSSIVKWRQENKALFLEKYNEKLTYTHIILYVAAQVLKEYPMINASAKDGQITLKKHINMGMATALPNGNLIVPVVKNAHVKKLQDIVITANDLAIRARNSKLLPDEIQGGTFTITNLGTFNTLTGTPIINQPQLAIMSTGVIKKRAVVIETENGDLIGVKPMMYLSLTYDHRVIDGAMGGMFLNSMVKALEDFKGTT